MHKRVRRNKAMIVASIFAITAMLLILGMAFSIIVNIQAMAESVKDDYNTIEIFLKDKVKKKDALAEGAKIEKWKGVASVDYRSKKQAMKLLKERWGKNGKLLDGLKENPLPNSLIITVEDLEQADGIAARAAKVSGAEDVKFYQETVDKLLKITRFIQWGAVIIMIVLVIIAIVVVANTIKLTVIGRADEISIMKYVGATDWFVRKPFLLEGVWIGIVSALIALAVIAVIYYRVVGLIGTQVMSVLAIPMVPLGFMMVSLGITFLILGTGIGALGSMISMRRYLDA